MSTAYIVAIGSSAGGMIAMQDFFEATHHDDVTYVILRHFLIQQKSKLQEILQQYSSLKVVEIDWNTRIERDNVYISPPSMYVTLNAAGFHLTPRNATQPYPNKTVDIFFNSLARMNRSRSIAVLLSGDGQDGTEGLKAIHSAGGLVIVQKPSSCEFPSMPQSAIDTGMVDLVLQPAAMPAAIAKHIESRILSFTE